MCKLIPYDPVAESTLLALDRGRCCTVLKPIQTLLAASNSAGFQACRQRAMLPATTVENLGQVSIAFCKSFAYRGTCSRSQELVTYSHLISVTAATALHHKVPSNSWSSKAIPLLSKFIRRARNTSERLIEGIRSVSVKSDRS